MQFWRGVFLSLEQNIGKEDEFQVSGGSEFQSRGPMTEKAFLPSDDLTYGMEKTSESEDLVETECDKNERLMKADSIFLIVHFDFEWEKHQASNARSSWLVYYWISNNVFLKKM